jgi:dipeptidyl aminopeptidase/acylaminoacyl peptidase
MKYNRSIGVVLLAAMAAGLAMAVPSALAQTARAGAAPAPKKSLADVGPGIERFVKIRTPGAPSVAPDGTMYVRDFPDGVNQLYRVRAETVKPDFDGEKLTNYADGLSGFSMSDDGSKILLVYSAGGNENNQVSLLNTATGETTEVLRDPRVQHSVNTWLRDFSGFIYSANDDSPNDFYLYRMDFTPDGKGKRTRLLGRAGSWNASDVTADGSRVLIEQYRSISDTSIYELNTATGDTTELTVRPASGETVYATHVGYTPGERGVLFISDMEEGLRKLYLRDLTTGEVTKPLSDLEGVELSTASINNKRTLLAAVTNEDGYGVLHVFRLPTFERVQLPEIEKGVVSLTDMRGDRLTWVLSNARTPGLAYTWTVPAAGAAAGPAKQLTFADDQGIDLSAFPLPELVRYKGFDGLSVPAFVFLPVGYTPGKPIPFVVNYHGGPESQFRPGFSSVVQYLLSEGFGVMQPNVRGSTGYGRAFHMLDDYKNRWNSVRDGVDAAAWLVKNGYARPGQIATYGGSYGGFMAVACLVEDQMRVDSGAQAQRLFGAGVKVVGIVNMQTFLEQTSGYRRKLREVEYGPLTDPEFLASVSPINHIDKINVPMMIAHGLNDPRVPVGEAMQLAVGLMNKGIEPLQVYFPDEGHGFAKLNNRLLFNTRMNRFLKEHIDN